MPDDARRGGGRLPCADRRRRPEDRRLENDRARRRHRRNSCRGDVGAHWSAAAGRRLRVRAGAYNSDRTRVTGDGRRDGARDRGADGPRGRRRRDHRAQARPDRRDGRVLRGVRRVHRPRAGGDRRPRDGAASARPGARGPTAVLGDGRIRGRRRHRVGPTPPGDGGGRAADRRAPDRVRTGGCGRRRRGGAALDDGGGPGPVHGRAPGEHARRARRLCRPRARLHLREPCGARPPRRAHRRERHRSSRMGDGAERGTRYDAHGGLALDAGASRAGACGSGPGGHAWVGAPAARARLRSIAAVRPAGDLPRLPADRRARGRRLGDELRLRIPDRGRGRRHQCLVARAGHRRAADPPGPGAPARRAPCRGVGLARTPPRGGDCGDLRGRRRRDRGPGPRCRVRRRRRDPDRPPRRRDGAVHGGVGRAVGQLPAGVRRGSREPVARDRARRAGDPRARGARRSGGRRARRPRACARVLDRARVRLDADASPRGPVDDAAAGGRGGRRRGMRARAGSCRPARCSGRRLRWWSGSRSRRPVRSRSFARSDCAPPGTTCESSRDSAGDGRRAVVERARGHARVPPLARRGDLPAPRGHRRRQRLERRKPRCRGQGASRRGTRPAGHESRVCRGHERRDRRSALARRRARHAPQQRHDRRAGVRRAAGRRARARRGRECVVLADRLPRRPGRDLVRRRRISAGPRSSRHQPRVRAAAGSPRRPLRTAPTARAVARCSSPQRRLSRSEASTSRSSRTPRTPTGRFAPRARAAGSSSFRRVSYGMPCPPRPAERRRRTRSTTAFATGSW